MEKSIFFLFPLLLFGIVAAAPRDTSYVVSSTEPSSNGGKEGTTSKNLNQHPEIYEMDISSNISNRFAKTLVVSKVRNEGIVAKETTFTVVLPDKAFISEFVMESGGKSYKAYIKGKEEAKQIYNEAVASGQSAGHVAVSTRNSKKFTVSVNVEPESKVVFLLTYEELLDRRNDQYELIVNIHPGQIVKDLNVKVQINESRPLKFVRTPSLRSGNEISKNEDKLNPSSQLEIINSTSAVVKFNPDSEDQRQFARYLGDKESSGLSGQFVVQYDVERDPHGGEVLLQDGYFVHFFAPTDLEPLPKHVLLVLDTSSSMSGRKIEQVKDALKSILNELREQDILSIIDFGSSVSVWNVAQEQRTPIDYGYGFNYEEPFSKLSKEEFPAALTADNQTLIKANRVIDSLRAYGMTNIIGGLEAALYLAKVRQDHPSDKKYQPVIIFLTDGDPNVGVYSTQTITNIVTRLNTESKIPIYSLSFGEDADKEFLRKLSLKNQGFARHIYEAADASLQIQEFYKQVSSPLLSNITFKYNAEVKEVTKTKFPIYFKGSEIVVSGRYDNLESHLNIARPVDCWATEPKVLPPTVERSVTSLERLWAYLTVKQLLDERELAENKTELTKKALDLALKYSFVTDITSLVVVKPNETTRVSTEDAYRAQTGDISDRTSTVQQSYYRSSGFSSSNRMFYQPHYSMLASRAYISPRIGSAYDYGGSYGSGIADYGKSAWPHPPPPPPTAAATISASKLSKFVDTSTELTSTSNPNALNISSPPTPSTTTIPKVVDILPWLASKLNPNGSLIIGQNIYDLGESYRPIIDQECPQTPLNATQSGTCSTLSLCPEVHSFLTDFSIYQQYFCSIEITDKKYAGVCCPPKKQKN
ncbi:inter-alpha-trypsin inhibitor heavy chain H4 isoform X2 [Anoplophora glabripennis]|uniref:inter-alpha-trypsin inhibitor heavy chain H4 isoform X2 n=1 Tax=Anoplophora glabripennis TaxID=217634 RepID=UPI0008741EC9|nr:inter-alpha-trypsin inhibitor heavy chain H4 isoform X2 [Anoplophora glabripennis]